MLQNLTLVFTQVPESIFTSELKIYVPVKKKPIQNLTYKHTKKSPNQNTIHSISNEWEPRLANARMSTIYFNTNWREMFKTKKWQSFLSQVVADVEVKSTQADAAAWRPKARLSSAVLSGSSMV